MPKKDTKPLEHVEDKVSAGADEAEPVTRVDRSLEKRVDHVSAEEATGKGKAARLAVPRSLHAAWAATRAAQPGRHYRRTGDEREPVLVPIRHGRMMVSPFTFYRGAAAIMAADLAATPVSGLRAPLCGDPTCSTSAASPLPNGPCLRPERFDETLPGPWEWDVKRLAASIEVAGRDSGMKPPERRAAVEATVGQYREALRGFAGQTELGVVRPSGGPALIALARSELGPKRPPIWRPTWRRPVPRTA